MLMKLHGRNLSQSSLPLKHAHEGAHGRGDRCVWKALTASTLIRYNETKAQVYLSDEMTRRFTLWWILSAEIDFIHKSAICRGTLRGCVCVHMHFHTSWPTRSHFQSLQKALWSPLSKQSWKKIAADSSSAFAALKEAVEKSTRLIFYLHSVPCLVITDWMCNINI